ncbi:5-formyltetrahydrofolate cyclo-ligase [Oceanobacter mangrovi]|uniref:5-formyltetrahydrofolate cyclo-ligase n=1 Tax=Oceanobacter mangrovi TaxID=2862510 RepID=UPI001C8D8F30|nr:5-formyltetrahydrofolate cyclo-ligase [Oceanobacter mangrovi]
MNKQQIRQQMRQQRRQLSRRQRLQAASGLRNSVLRSGLLLRGNSAALYLVNDGEIDTRPLIRQIQSMGKRVYLPVLHPLKAGHLVFIEYHRNTRMRQNRFGIPEPDFRYGKRLSAAFISHIFMPLVAFDEAGHRLGMGGGFYDRTLAFTRNAGHKPRLTGCAHEFQKLSAIPAESWDIPLSAIATDVTLRIF